MSINKVKQMKQLYQNLEVIQDEEGSIVGMFLTLNAQLKLRWRAAKPTIWDIWNPDRKVAIEVTSSKVPVELQRTAQGFIGDWNSLDECKEEIKENIIEATFEEVVQPKQIKPKGVIKKVPAAEPVFEVVESITLPAVVGIGIVRPAVSAMEAVAAWKEFQALKKAVLDPSDLHRIKDKDFIKKSGWRKFATFYNLTDKIVEEEKMQIDNTEYIWKIKVICTAANGRETEGVAMCSSKEKSGPRQMHDTYTTCHTRAKNRAISDMIAAGEVSAEEMEE